MENEISGINDESQQKQKMEEGNKQSTQTNMSEKSEDIVAGRIKDK